MRWLDFMRLRAGQRVVWIPTSERGVVRKKDGRELWVEWSSGRTEKLHVDEDALSLMPDSMRLDREVSVQELQRRRAIASLAPPDCEDGSAQELERVWREAAELRAERSKSTRAAHPSLIRFETERSAIA